MTERAAVWGAGRIFRENTPSGMKSPQHTLDEGEKERSSGGTTTATNSRGYNNLGAPVLLLRYVVMIKAIGSKASASAVAALRGTRCFWRDDIRVVRSPH
jgi:hypothetical protein